MVFRENMNVSNKKKFQVNLIKLKMKIWFQTYCDGYQEGPPNPMDTPMNKLMDLK